jgi:hypothetical protein
VLQPRGLHPLALVPGPHGCADPLRVAHPDAASAALPEESGGDGGGGRVACGVEPTPRERLPLLAELCKYNAASWAAVGKLLLRHRLERSLLRAITSHTFETSFFLRSLILSCYPELRSQRARRLTMAELVAMRKERLRRNPELEDHELSDAYAHATFESQEVILSRMYHVRTVSYDLYRRKVQDAGEIFDALETSPAACPMSERCRWLHVPCSCVPTAQEGPISTVGADECGDALTFERDPQVVSAIAELPSLWPLVQEALPVLFRNLMGHLNCEEVETSDHVCVVTTSVAVALAAYCRGGEAGVEELIRAAVGLHDAEREEVTRRHEAKKEAYMQQQQQSAPHVHGHGGGGNETTTGAAGVVDSDEDDASFAERVTRTHPPAPEHDRTMCDSCAVPPTTVGKRRRTLALNDLAGNYYRILCVWLAHYQVQRNYFMTLVFCTEIDVPRWKAIAAVLLRVLPKYFKN